MKIICDKDQLYSGISIAGRAISTRTTMPVLEGIYMEALGDSLHLVCTDMTIGIETSIPAQVIDKGTSVVPGKLFTEFARKLPSGSIELDFHENMVDIKANGSEASLHTLSPEDFPSLPEVLKAGEIQVRQDRLRNMINRSIFSAATDESRPILTGVLLELDGEEARLVALDGYRLALCRTGLDADYGKQSAIVPSSSFAEIAKLPMNDQNTKLYISGAHLIAENDGTRVITRLLEGEFIKYSQILPADWQTQVTINKSRLEASIDRASTLAREANSNLITFDIRDGMIYLSSKSEMGSVNEELACTVEGKELQIAFNARYLSDVMKNIDDEEILMKFNTNVSPCIITPFEGNAYIYLVLPVRIYTQ